MALYVFFWRRFGVPISRHFYFWCMNFASKKVDFQWTTSTGIKHQKSQPDEPKIWLKVLAQRFDTRWKKFPAHGGQRYWHTVANTATTWEYIATWCKNKENLKEKGGPCQHHVPTQGIGTQSVLNRRLKKKLRQFCKQAACDTRWKFSKNLYRHTVWRHAKNWWLNHYPLWQRLAAQIHIRLSRFTHT